MAEPILEVKGLKTYFFSNGTQLRAADDLSYTVHKGECVAIIGESGSGKTVEALSILRLIPFPPMGWAVASGFLAAQELASYLP